MTEPLPTTLQAEAIAWQLRLADADADLWDAFTAWLEADPLHAAAYDALAEADAALADAAWPVPAQPKPALPTQALPTLRRPAWRRWPVAAAALAAVLLLGFFLLPRPGAAPQPYEIATAAGQRRTVPLGDGGAVELNGGSRLILDRADPRRAELAAGEATFTVRHDAARPFTVQLGDHRIEDVGTTFNLVRDGTRLTVEVLEGEVLFDRGPDQARLGAGQRLSLADGGAAMLDRRAPANMAGWRHGQLSYRAAPLSEVAADLSRNLGAEVTLEPALRATPFTGSIRIAGGPAATLADLAAATGLAARRTATGWRLEQPARR